MLEVDMLFDWSMGGIKLLIQIMVLATLFVLETLIPYFAFGRGKLKHGARNLSLGLINGLIVALLFAAVMAAVTTWSAQRGFGLVHWLGGPYWLKTLLVLVLFDLWMYVWHRLNHQIKFLWRFHRVHHSDCALDVTSALRFHTGEIVLSSLARLLILPLLGMSLGQLILYETLLQPIILFHHSNVNVPEPLDRILRLFIVTPHMHWVHHSDRPQETDSNYSSILSCWDRLARSFRLQDPKAIHYGLKEFPDEQAQTLKGMLKTPLR